MLLLTTKLHVPPRTRQNLVERPRLTQQLLADRPLTLISAPPGFGKTTLLQSWIPLSPCCVTWLSLDAGDNDPARFWTYFIAALQTLDAQLGADALALLCTPQTQLAPLEVIVTILLNDLAALRKDLACVLDDYHMIDNHALHEAMTYLIDHLPEHVRVILICRSDPPLPLARWRARDQLTEIRAGDLRFTSDEAAAFLTEVMGLSLSASEAAALETRAEGWIAGLQLAALSMQGHQDIAGFISAFTGSHRYIIDYLAEEVIQRQPAPVQTFLLHTSVLERFSGALCDTLLERSGSQAVLEQLEHGNLFLISLDGQRQWYRFHHLFADVLRSILQRDQPETVIALHRRASDWYAHNGLMAEAIAHALTIKDFERAARLIEQEAEPCLKRSEYATLQRWLAVLPAETLHAHPGLLLCDATARVIKHELDEAERALREAEAAIAVIPADRRERLLSEIAAIGAMIALNRNDVPRTIELARQALAHLPDDRLHLRGSVMLHLGAAYDWNGQLVEAKRCFVEATRLGEAAGDLQTALLAIANQAATERTRARYQSAAALYHYGLRLDEKYRPTRAPAAVYLFTDLADVLYEWNDLDGANVHIQEAIERCNRAQLIRALVVIYRQLARLRFSQGDPAAAFEAINKALQLAHDHQVPSHYVSPALAQRVKLLLANGDLAAASRWAHDSDLADTDALITTREDEYLALARVWTAAGQPDRALQLLAQLQQDAESRGRIERSIFVLHLQALAYRARGDASQAMEALERSLVLAEPAGFIRTFVDEGEPMRLLISDFRLMVERRARAGNAEVMHLPPYVDKLLAAFPTSGNKATVKSIPPQGYHAVSHSAGMLRRQPSATLIEPLSERELEVLWLIHAGRSNREIADQLVIAPSTVKKHINNIFGKLGVQSRTQALARARELGVL
jgi:LuxR family maltose regulon positive regulatory protein